MSKIQAREKIVLEAGFRQAYTPSAKADELSVIRVEESRLKNLKKRQRVTPHQVRIRKEIPPQGLTEAELLRMLHFHGIGRPATYAGIVETLLRRAYVVHGEDGTLQVTERGQQVCDFLVQNYPEIFSPAYSVMQTAEK